MLKDTVCVKAPDLGNVAQSLVSLDHSDDHSAHKLTFQVRARCGLLLARLHVRYRALVHLSRIDDIVERGEQHNPTEHDRSLQDLVSFLPLAQSFGPLAYPVEVLRRDWDLDRPGQEDHHVQTVAPSNDVDRHSSAAESPRTRRQRSTKESPPDETADRDEVRRHQGKNLERGDRIEGDDAAERDEIDEDHEKPDEDQGVDRVGAAAVDLCNERAEREAMVAGERKDLSGSGCHPVDDAEACHDA